MYKRDRIKTRILYACGALAILICLALTGFMVYSLRLRTEYRAFCLEVNDAILAVPEGQITISRQEKSAPASVRSIDYFNAFLLDSGTLVYNRRCEPVTDESIVIRLGKKKAFILTGLEDGSVINVRFETPEGTRGFSVLGGYIQFSDLCSRADIYLQRAGEQ